MNTSLLIVLNNKTVQIGLSGVVIGTYALDGKPIKQEGKLAISGLNAFDDLVSLRKHLNYLTHICDLKVPYDSYTLIGIPGGEFEVYNKGFAVETRIAQADSPRLELAAAVDDIIERATPTAPVSEEETRLIQATTLLQEIQKAGIAQPEIAQRIKAFLS